MFEFLVFLFSIVILYKSETREMDALALFIMIGLYIAKDAPIF